MIYHMVIGYHLNERFSMFSFFVFFFKEISFSREPCISSIKSRIANPERCKNRKRRRAFPCFTY